MDQCSNIVILGEKNPILSDGLGQQRSISGIRRPLGGINDVMAKGAQSTHGLRNDVGVRKKTHAIRRG